MAKAIGKRSTSHSPASGRSAASPQSVAGNDPARRFLLWLSTPAAAAGCALAVVLLLTASARWQWLSMPLERDEGEFAYIGEQILSGIPPYRDVANLKWPGTYAMYALGMAVFGRTTEGIHALLMVVNLASILVLFLIARRLAGHAAASTAAAALALLTINPRILGFAAHATHFVVLAALLAIWLLQRSLERGSLGGILHAGVWFGVSTLMKQPGVFFGALGAVLILDAAWRQGGLWQRRTLAQLIALALGASVSIAATFAWLYVLGVFPTFWLWTVEYAGHYGWRDSWSEWATVLRVNGSDALLTNQRWLLLVAAVGATLPWWCAALRATRIPALAWLCLSFLAVCPGGVFRSHYFVLMTPAIALSAGLAIQGAYEHLRVLRSRPAQMTIAAALAGLALGPTAERHARWVYTVPLEQVIERIYDQTPFVVAPRIAALINRRSTANDLIAVLGSEPEVLFYAHRRSAARFLYTYPLTELQPYAEQMRQMLKDDLQRNQPNYVVWVNDPFSWVSGPKNDITIIDWVSKYLEAFEVIGAATFKKGEPTAYFEGEAARQLPLYQEEKIMFVLRRRES